MSPRLNLIVEDEEEESQQMPLVPSHENVGPFSSSPTEYEVVELVPSTPTRRLMSNYHVALAAAVMVILFLGNTLFASHYCARQVQNKIASIVEISRRREGETIAAMERYLAELGKVESGRHQTSSQLLRVLEELQELHIVAYNIGSTCNQTSTELLQELEELEQVAYKQEEEILRWKNQVDFLQQQLGKSRKEAFSWKSKVDVLQQKLFRSRRELRYCAGVGCHILEI